MRFTVVPKIELNPDIGDISLHPLFPGRGTLTCRKALPSILKLRETGVFSTRRIQREDSIY